MNLLFWTFFPDEGLVLLVALAGLILILGFREAAMGLLGTVVLFALLGPVIESLVAGLDPFWQFVILAALGLAIIHALILLIIGRDTASHLAALLLHDLIILPFRLLSRLLFGGGVGRRGH